MTLSPELQLLILNAAILAVAYWGIYPSIEPKTLNRIMLTDLGLSVVALVVAGALFWGSGIGFSMLLFETNWAVFSIVTLMVMEVPLFLRFCRQWGLNLFDDED